MSQPSRAVRNNTGNFWSRYGAHLIDVLLWAAALLIVALVSSSVALLTVVAAIGPLNQVVLEGLTGQSVGKRTAGLSVVTGTGHRPGILRAAVRYVALLGDAALLWLPALASMWVSPTQQRLGDRLAGTYVVDTTRFAIRSYTDLEVGDRASDGLRMDLLGPGGVDPSAIRAVEGWAAGWYPDPSDRDR